MQDGVRISKVKYIVTTMSTVNYEIKEINRKIKSKIYNDQKDQVRREIKPGNAKSLLTSGKINKDENINQMPDSMHIENRQLKKKKSLKRLRNFLE